MVRIRKSTIIEAPVDAVWAVLRDFNGHDRWHPAVADSELEDGRATDMIGAVRSFHLASGEHLREQLLALSDRERTLSYCIVESPIPLLGYVAHIRLLPVTDGNATYWEWISSFRTPPGREGELAQMVGEGVYVAGFEAIRGLLAGGRVSEVRSPVRTDSPVRAASPVRTDSPARTASPARIASAANAGEIAVDAITLQGYGGSEVLHPATIVVPPPPPGQVRIRHAAIGLNYIDVYCRTGQFDLVDPDGGVPGLEAAGVITEVGAGVSDLRTGDRVAYATLPAGAYAQVRNLPAERLVRLPDDVDHDVAAAALVKGLTAHFLLHEVHRLQAGESVLIHAAAGGVGQLLTQWAHAIGARVIGTVGSAAKQDVARANGCDAVIDYSQTDFAEAVADLTAGKGVNLVVDGVGRDTFARSLDALAPCGHLISYGQASGAIGSWNIDALAARSLTISRPNFGHYTDTAAKLNTGATRLFDMMRSGALSVHIERRFPLREAAAAHDWLQSRQGVGSNLLIP